MKIASKILLLLFALGAVLAHAQTNLYQQVQHVIVVIQENRSPDNLFGSDAFATQPQLPGADLTQTGNCSIPGQQIIQLQPLNLGNICDPYHGHSSSWIPTYDQGKMDGACTIGKTHCGNMSNPEYTYVESSNVAPYFQIARQYGYANYMFQTNQGPSFPAHQFLLSGTSAPLLSGGTPDPCISLPSDYPCWEWFAAENAVDMADPYGCTAGSTVVAQIDPAGTEANNGYNNALPCYNHNTLVDLLYPDQQNNVGWKYYSQGDATGLWTAPNANVEICGKVSGGSCTGSLWQHYVLFPYSNGYPNSYSPILTDLGADPGQSQCALPAVSWVVPDGNWSDHGGEDPRGAGPSWVAAIVNAVGGYNNSGGPNPISCFDMIGGKKVPYWQDTVVLITWDDWGGWYDHILPWRCNNVGVCSGYPNGQDGGGSEYVYGFRVPLLVVSAYANQGYISGACGPPPLQNTCPNEQQKYIHDFGSILNFIEYAFGTGGLPLGGTGGISPSYQYADYFAPDGPVVCGVTTCPYSLSDFFSFGGNPTTFTPFTSGAGVNYATQCFLTPNIPGCFPGFTPADPDADAIDPN